MKVLRNGKVVVRAIEFYFFPMRLFLDMVCFIGIARIFIKRDGKPNEIKGLQKRLDFSLSSWDYEANLDGLLLTERSSFK